MLKNCCYPQKLKSLRYFEFLLILEVGLLLLLLLFGKKLVNRWVISIFMVLTLICHYLFEGHRWQMYPVYIMALSILIFYNPSFLRKRKWHTKVFLIFCLLILAASGTAGKLVPVFDLPNKTSKYAVGTSNFTLEDPKRSNRKLRMKFWFPTSKKGSPDGVYSENPTLTLDGLFDMPGFVFGHLNRVETETYNNAEILNDSIKFPLVVYSHGAASTHLDNTALLREIAGEGYVVLALDHDFSFSDYGLKKSDAMTLEYAVQKAFITDLIDKVVPNQAQDIEFILRNLPDSSHDLIGHINFNKIVLVGHSLGGTTATDASLKVKGVQAIINMDGPLNTASIEHLELPFLYMSSFSPDLADELLEEKGLPDAQLYRQIKQWELENVYRLYYRNTIGFHWVRFKNAGHMDFTDVPFMLPIMKTDGYDEHEGHLLKSSVILDFIDIHLKNAKNYQKITDHSLEWIK